MRPLYQIYDPWIIDQYKSRTWRRVMENGINETMDGPIDSAFGLWYYPALNAFFDENDNLVVDLHKYFDPWVVREWKKQGGYSAIEAKNGDLIELFYANEEDEEYLFASFDRTWQDWERDNYERYCSAMYHDWELESKTVG